MDRRSLVTSPGLMREAHPMLSKSIQSIVGIFVGFAIGGLLGLVATPPGPAPSTRESGFIAEVGREPEPVAVTLTTVLGPTTTRVPRDDALVPSTPVLAEATPTDPSPTTKATKATKATSTKPAASTPTKKAAPKPKTTPSPRTPAPAPPAVEPPAPVVDSPPPPEPRGEKHKGSKRGPDKPPKPPKPPK